MYRTGIVVSVLALLGSVLGALFIPMYLDRAPSGGDEGILYAVGVMLTVPALLAGVIAAVLLRRVPPQAGLPDRFLARRFWLPVCPPLLVLLGLHLMLLAKGAW